MPYILIDRKINEEKATSEVEIITTPRIYDKIIHEREFLVRLRSYIMEIAEQREFLGADSKDAKAEKKKKCCDNVEGCGRSFYIFVMFREVIEESNLN